MFEPRGVITSPRAAGAAAQCTSSDNLFGRGGYGACPGPPGLKVMAVVSWRLMNSPAAWVYPAAVRFLMGVTVLKDNYFLKDQFCTCAPIEAAVLKQAFALPIVSVGAG